MSRLLEAIVFSALLVGCGDSVESTKDGGGNCTDVFTTKVNYAGQEVVVGCYYPGTYSITASIVQTSGTCQAVFQWQSASASSHQCTATLSGNATSGYDLDYPTCSLPGAIHVLPDLSSFTGHFDWTVSCGSGTTTFQSITRK